MFKFLLGLCLSLLISNSKANVVSFIDPCKIGDNDCLMKSSIKALPYFVAGIPELGVPSADPLVLDNSINCDTGELKLEFKNLVVSGIGKCQFNKIERPEHLKLNLAMECPFTAKGQYVVGGKLAIVPIHGVGDCEIKTDKIKIEVDISLIKTERDGKEYYKTKSFNYKYYPVSKVSFDLHNLFDGDKEKAEPVMKILDESWEGLVKEVGQPVVKNAITKSVHCVDTFFQAVPTTEIDKH